MTREAPDIIKLIKGGEVASLPNTTREIADVAEIREVVDFDNVAEIGDLGEIIDLDGVAQTGLLGNTSIPNSAVSLHIRSHSNFTLFPTTPVLSTGPPFTPNTPILAEDDVTVTSSLYLATQW